MLSVGKKPDAFVLKVRDSATYDFSTRLTYRYIDHLERVAAVKIAPNLHHAAHSGRLIFEGSIGIFTFQRQIHADEHALVHQTSVTQQVGPLGFASPYYYVNLGLF